MATLIPGLLTYVDWIDEQHRELFDYLNALKETSSERVIKEVGEILHYFGKYIINYLSYLLQTVFQSIL